MRGALGPAGRRHSAIALFSDQATAEAELLAQPGGDFVLAVGPHRTARGADIAAKTWRLSLQGESSSFRFNVVVREK